ncbi:MAG: GIY-YIG nuclease family protein [Firmicutes bacterium]|nr:GIY-YIG nuclease family protein [Bacillota bacterium]
MYYIYILTNYDKTTLYIGVTNDLQRRLYEHRNNEHGFTSEYRCYQLVYFEYTESIESAILREKQLKGWTRQKKEKLIKSMNPSWKDLSYSLNLR